MPVKFAEEEQIAPPVNEYVESAEVEPTAEPTPPPPPPSTSKRDGSRDRQTPDRPSPSITSSEQAPFPMFNIRTLRPVRSPFMCSSIDPVGVFTNMLSRAACMGYDEDGRDYPRSSVSVPPCVSLYRDAGV